MSKTIKSDTASLPQLYTTNAIWIVCWAWSITPNFNSNQFRGFRTQGEQKSASLIDQSYHRPYNSVRNNMRDCDDVMRLEQCQLCQCL